MTPRHKMVPFALCVAILASPTLAQAQTRTVPARSQSQLNVKDISLRNGGLVKGVALNTAAQPLAGTEVVVQYGSHVIARTKTGADGSFAIKGLRAGAHTVTVGSNSQVVRFWTADAAPKNAIHTLAVNGDQSNAVRGQMMPALNLPVVCAAVAFGVIGGVIGYNVKDDDSNNSTSSP